MTFLTGGNVNNVATQHSFANNLPRFFFFFFFSFVFHKRVHRFQICIVYNISLESTEGRYKSISDDSRFVVKTDCFYQPFF